MEAFIELLLLQSLHIVRVYEYLWLLHLCSGFVGCLGLRALSFLILKDPLRLQEVVENFVELFDDLRPADHRHLCIYQDQIKRLFLVLPLVQEVIDEVQRRLTALKALNVAFEAHHLELELEGAEVHKIVIYAQNCLILRRQTFAGTIGMVEQLIVFIDRVARRPIIKKKSLLPMFLLRSCSSKIAAYNALALVALNQRLLILADECETLVGVLLKLHSELERGARTLPLV